MTIVEECASALNSGGSDIAAGRQAVQLPCAAGPCAAGSSLTLQGLLATIQNRSKVQNPIVGLLQFGRNRRKGKGDMTTVIIAVLAVLAALGLGIATWLGIRQRVQASRLATANEAAGDLTAQAQEESRKLVLGAQEEALKLRNEAESEIKEQRRELTRLEDRHMQREEQLERKIEAQDKRQTELAEKETEIEESRKEVEELKTEQARVLERIAGLSVEEAREAVIRTRRGGCPT